jgi:hypothetical protein
MMKITHKIEAEGLLRKHMDEIRMHPFADLVTLLDTADAVEVVGETGKRYQIEVNAMWDDDTKTRLRVCGSIDDGGFRAWINCKPLVQDFLTYPNGKME